MTGVRQADATATAGQPPHIAGQCPDLRAPAASCRTTHKVNAATRGKPRIEPGPAVPVVVRPGAADRRHPRCRAADDGATIADLARWLAATCWPGSTLIRAEIDRRLAQARTSDPVTRQRTQIELALAKAATSITAMIQAYSEQLITIDELRARMPDLRARQASLRSQLDALDAQAADRDACLKLAGDLEGFLARLRGSAATATAKTAGACCGCWSRTSSSARRRSPSATASRSGNQPPAAAATTTQPTRRVTCAQVMNCVGGVSSQLCGDEDQGPVFTCSGGGRAPWLPLRPYAPQTRDG